VTALPLSRLSSASTLTTAMYRPMRSCRIKEVTAVTLIERGTSTGKLSEDPEEVEEDAEVKRPASKKRARRALDDVAGEPIEALRKKSHRPAKLARLQEMPLEVLLQVCGAAGRASSTGLTILCPDLRVPTPARASACLAHDKDSTRTPHGALLPRDLGSGTERRPGHAAVPRRSHRVCMGAAAVRPRLPRTSFFDLLLLCIC
jgi:hypothetical protein